MGRWKIAGLIVCLVGALVADADAKKKKKKRKKGRAVVEEVAVTGPVTVKLRAFDRLRLKALVEITGLKKPPKPNFFIFTDERKRHYVAMDTKCEAPLPSGTLSRLPSCRTNGGSVMSGLK